MRQISFPRAPFLYLCLDDLKVAICKVFPQKLYCSAQIQRIALVRQLIKPELSFARLLMVDAVLDYSPICRKEENSILIAGLLNYRKSSG